VRPSPVDFHTGPSCRKGRDHLLQGVEGELAMKWFPRVALVAAVVGLAVPVATARATTTIQKDIPFEATIEGCAETITLSGHLLGVFIEQPLGTFINRFHIVGTRGAPTYYVKENAHITVTPSGDVAVFFDNLRLECG
jgi:hypothetical protein